MVDDTGIRQPEDPTKINLGQSWEIRYWTQRFGVPEETLRKAVKEVGVLVKDVEEWLKNNA
jgi:hypothetical protein